MPIAKKNKPLTPDQKPSEQKNGDKLNLGPVKFERLFCHSPECEGKHQGTSYLVVYLHWGENEVVIEPIFLGLTNYRSDMLERYYPQSRMIQKITQQCPLIQYFNIKILPVNGGFSEEDYSS